MSTSVEIDREREAQMKIAFEKAKAREEMRLAEVRNCFKAANKEVQRQAEMQAISQRLEAVKFVADLYDISSYELLYYNEHGEEAAEAHFNKLRLND